jgi:hypothetical protein
MSSQVRYRCRNQRCRLKLPVPTENEHHAFCCRGCYESFHHSRCRVCEADLRKQGRRGDAGRLYCRPPSQCAAEARKWPEKYAFPASPLPYPAFSATNVKSADSTGLKSAHEGDRPSPKCLSHWRWGGDPDSGDHSLYDSDGLTVARVVLEADGRYRLRSPIAGPRQSWFDLDEAKRRVEAVALSAMPLDSKTAAAARRNNETPHPLARKFPALAG